jgi:hypothetical protein
MDGIQCKTRKILSALLFLKSEDNNIGYRAETANSKAHGKRPCGKSGKVCINMPVITIATASTKIRSVSVVCFNGIGGIWCSNYLKMSRKLRILVDTTELNK